GRPERSPTVEDGGGQRFAGDAQSGPIDPGKGRLRTILVRNGGSHGQQRCGADPLAIESLLNQRQELRWNGQGSEETGPSLYHRLAFRLLRLAEPVPMLIQVESGGAQA